MNDSTVSGAIYAILFSTSAVWTVSELAQAIGIDEAAVAQGLEELAEDLVDQSVMLVRNGDTVTIGTKPEYTELLTRIRREELQTALSKASAETLAVILYSNQSEGISKAQIELIRGVNATYSLRNLQVRGLIESVGSGRQVLYVPTVQLLQSFGVANVSELPAYAETCAKITSLLQTQ